MESFHLYYDVQSSIFHYIFLIHTPPIVTSALCQCLPIHQDWIISGQLLHHLNLIYLFICLWCCLFSTKQTTRHVLQF